MKQPSIVIRDIQIVNRGVIKTADIYIKDGLINKIDGIITHSADIELDGSGKHLIPGIIDTQVHFREPGLTHKASIYTEAKAAVMGGVTSFMEMPNTKPPAITKALLEEKYALGAAHSVANYSFFMGATNDNVEEVLKAISGEVCGVKIFMGSSTGNMLVDQPKALHTLFSEIPILISTHCEDEQTIKRNEAAFLAAYGEDIPISCHPEIRSVKACLLSSELAVSLAKSYGTRLHILHISTSDELYLFDNNIPLKEKKITSEVCVHHLYFNANDYDSLGSLIKCNPAIKSEEHQKALLSGLLSDQLDIIATDHAPHTLTEKRQNYFSAPSGVPLVQHSLQIMLDFYHNGMISLEKMVEKMCHAPSDCFRIKNRGYVEEGYAADLAVIDIDTPYKVTTENIAYQCKWSPLLGKTMKGAVLSTIVNGNLVWHEGKINDDIKGERLAFIR
ncbi:MAG: dihydroorotase [Bacteroidota bacterium]